MQRVPEAVCDVTAPFDTYYVTTISTFTFMIMQSDKLKGKCRLPSISLSLYGSVFCVILFVHMSRLQLA